MSNYATKNQVMPDWFNPDEWIRKVDIPPCPECPNMDDYVLKADIPVLIGKKRMKCPVCPICPTCPKCPVSSGKIVEKIIYKEKMKNPMITNNPNQFYKEGEKEFEKPKYNDSWVPQLPNSSSGFIDPNVPMAGNAYMFRSKDVLMP
jgi:hypothetical protein